MRSSSAGLVICSVFAACAAFAAEGTVSAPVFLAGDSWVFDHAVEKGPTGYAATRLDEIIERVGDDTMVVGIKRDGAPTGFEDHVVGRDWSQRRIVDGEQTTTVRPFSYPLRVGKTWSVEFRDPTRRGQQLSAHVRRTYTVVGWRDVTVPAGTFRALEVQAKGIDEGVIEVPNVAASGVATEPGEGSAFSTMRRGGRGTLTRATYTELYYVPAVKDYVESTEEQYTPDNVLVSRTTEKLVSFTSAK